MGINALVPVEEAVDINGVACLERAKRSTLRLRQVSPFAPLGIYRRGEEADAA